MIRSTTLALTLSVAAASLAACGGSPGQSRAEDEVRAAVRDWWHALTTGDASRGCARLAPTARRQFVASVVPEVSDCAGAVAQVNRMMTPQEKAALARVRIHRMRVRGDRVEIRDADAEVPPPLAQDVNDRPTVLRRVRGRWLVEDLG